MLLRLLWPLACLAACGDPSPKTDPHAEAWSAQYDAGRAAFAQSRFDEACAAFTTALTLAKHFDPDDPRYGRATHQLAQLHVLQGELAEAESLYVDLREREASLPAHSPAKILTLDKLGDTYRLQKRLAEAAALYAQVLAFQQTHQGDGAVATTLQKLADVYRARGHRARADSLTYTARALTLRTQAHGYFVQGNYEQAEPLLQSALALQEQHFGVDHPDLARTCYYTGRFYAAQDQYRKAAHFYRRALDADPADPDRAREALDALPAH